MRARLLSQLACPLTGETDLRLVAWRVEREGGFGEGVWLAPAAPPDALPHAETLEPDDGVMEGAVVVGSTGHWYPIHRGIAHLVRDPLRYSDVDAGVAARLAALPEPSRRALSPALRTEPIAPSADLLGEADLRLLDEDRYWGGFFRLHWDAGDRSIFDMHAKGSHPTFWPAGVREPDRRDLEREWGVWPNHLGRWLFGEMREWNREAQAAVGMREQPWAWDAGCGGGQFAIQAARSGYATVGTDIATEALVCGLARAQEAHVRVDYVRAENARPPFRPCAFRLVVCKDTIHHEPDVAATLDAWTRTMAPGARVLFYEHHGANALAARLLAFASCRLLPRITRRYPTDPMISPYFQGESANEDVGRDAVMPALLERFADARACEEVRLYHDLDALLWYAFMKWRRPARLVSEAVRLADPWLRALGGAQYLAFKATWQPGQDRQD
jgi:ubiquinone/menaquinone biosynthesis C-methylase UbiE/uncharacterized protein YbaR (Trm112 family)